MDADTAAEQLGNLDGQTVMVTGGTGSFGKAFARRILRSSRPERLIVFSRDELKQFDMRGEFDDECLRFFIGDVRDRDRLTMAMNGVDIVIHAAAMKQVEAAEYNPYECINTNIRGAENVIHAALANGVRRVIALSTDKASRPINLYGATKLASDKLFVAANHYAGRSSTRFSVVRYGNVAGSRGSVIPVFQRLLEQGARQLPITDPKMTRFWITLEDAVAFVIDRLSDMSGGEIFVPKIPSFRITDLARAIAPQLPHKTIGIRPGEKMHEMMIGEEDSLHTREHPGHFVILPAISFRSGSAEIGVREGGRPVDPNFEYRSDTNTDWLRTDALRRFLNPPRRPSAKPALQSGEATA